jgi:hypothetical protein
MRIEQKTPTQLIAKNPPCGTWIGSSVLVMLGASLFAVPPPSANEVLSAQVVAYVFIAWGVGTLLSGKSITWTFDKSDNSFLIQSQILFVTQTLKYALTEIDKVQIESKPTGEGGETYTYGIKLLLTGGKRLHLCSGFGLSEFTAKEGVRRISSFLELRQ